MAFTATTTNSAAAWRPDEYVFHAEDTLDEALIVGHSTKSGVVDGDEPSVRVAYVVDDAAQFTAEGSDIPEAEPALSEVLVHTAKITQLVRLSGEQYEQEGTAARLAHSVSRAIIRRADLAFVAQVAPTPPAVAPAAGLVNVDDVTTGDPVAESLDALVDLIAELEDNDAMPTAILVDPLGWAALRKLRTATGSNMSLIGAGSADAAPMLLSLPVVVHTAVPDYTGIVVDRSAVVSAYGGLHVATSMHQYFSSDSIAIRATWRIGHAVVRPERLGVFTIGDEGS